MVTKKIRIKIKEKLKKSFSVLMAVYFFCLNILPQNAFALTGGPSQPEVQSFEPVGTSEMVDLFSGDFTYNIPLLDVEGYPINLSYNSGISMDQEASWVGLGWNINPGVINRGLRGIPDDFNGEMIENEVSMKPNRTFGANFGVDLELIGLDKNIVGLGAGVSYGINYNNYVGVGLELGMGINASIGSKNSGALTGGLGITSNSAGGISISPELSLSTKIAGLGNLPLNIKIGSSFNNRSGMQQLTINTSTSFVKMPIGIVGANFNFGQPTFTPQVGTSMFSYNISMRANVGAEAFGAHPAFSINGFYSEQTVANGSKSNPAYGYFFLEQGQGNDNAIMDFNREKDGSFSATTPGLPLANLTNDIFSVNGQGVGGSYRAFRNDVGHVFDAKSNTFSASTSVGAELGVGALAHAGYNAAITISNGTSGNWRVNNGAAPYVSYRTTKPTPDYENFYLKEANEKSVTSDPTFMARMGGTSAVRFELNKISDFNVALSNQLSGGSNVSISNNQKQKREKRNQLISFLSKKEVADGMGVETPTSSAPNHHIGEITTLNTEGARYVYGIPLYNNTQEEVTFAIKDSYSKDYAQGLVDYIPGDNSFGNENGVDHYYSKTKTPAYAHSYLLTAVLSPDYIDIDGIQGPSKGDFGTYTKFTYSVPIDYNWRTPVGVNKASFNEGLLSTTEDDKASYIYGTKQLRYLEKLETKNYVAIFHTSAIRNDAKGVADENGAISSVGMNKLEKISLYTQEEYQANLSDLANAIPIKEVHFVYDYSLCQQIPNNPSGGGKLTLKQVYFTYRKSKKGKLTPYEFTYSNSNPTYNLKGYDRWGNYKPNSTTLTNGEFPYVDQTNPNLQNTYAAAWSLTRIDLPSGGKIEVDYESDDYAYVQNKKAMQMFKLSGVTNESNNVDPISGNSINLDGNSKLYFSLDPSSSNINDYVGGISYLYFKCLVDFGSGYDYVPGYARIKNKGISGNQGWVELEPVSLGDEASGTYNPIVKAGVQFGRLYLSKFIFNQPVVDDDAGFAFDYINALVQTFANFKDMLKSPNQSIYDMDRGRKINTDKSWIRLNNVNGKKQGGGVRVKKLRINDEWESMTASSSIPNSEYGQEYDYSQTLTNGQVISSGVAAYEPQIGGEENPWRQPVFFNVDNALVPDDRFYQEEPYGESFFPTPSVGYSQVTVKNILRPGVKRHATGKVVHKFYTAKEFPTITSKTDLRHYRDKSDPFSIFSLFSTTSEDFMTASQGYAIEVNDMHGKPKSQEVYPEGKTIPISSIEYRYKSSPYLADGSRRLSNTAKVIHKNGNVENAEIGVFFDMVTDMREQQNLTITPSVNINTDVILFFIAAVPIPMIWPHNSSDQTQFRSASTTKVVQRFGLLEEVIAKDLGSVVSTNNLAYDAETGDVLLTQTTTNFNDNIYTLNYPAHWYYDAMGMAYQNIGFTTAMNLSGGVGTPTHKGYFTEGDEVMLTIGSNVTKGWITEIHSDNSVTVVDFHGNTINDGGYTAKVIRSGRRNMTSQTMANIVTLTNPLNAFSANIYEQVIQASAIEFSDGWKTHCDCFEGELLASTNPYIIGTRGIFKPKTSYLHLTKRAQDNYDGNTNIRKDGIMTSYTPFYRLNYAKKWEIDKKDWTYTSEVTEFNPYGQELENRDALGRFSAATFGFNQSMATAVAANAQYKEVGFDSFEDYGFSDCADNHFKFNSITPDVSQSHTGTKSIKVSSGTSVTLEKQIEPCLNLTDCNLDLVLGIGDKGMSIKPLNGTPTYVVDYTIINGDVSLTYDDVEFSFSGEVSTSDSFIIQFTYTDSKGCSITKTLTKVYGRSSDGYTLN